MLDDIQVIMYSIHNAGKNALIITSDLFRLQSQPRKVWQKLYPGMQRKEPALFQSDSYSLDRQEKTDTANHECLKVNFAELVWKTRCFWTNRIIESRSRTIILGQVDMVDEFISHQTKFWFCIFSVYCTNKVGNMQRTFNSVQQIPWSGEGNAIQGTFFYKLAGKLENMS